MTAHLNPLTPDTLWTGVGPKSGLTYTARLLTPGHMTKMLGLQHTVLADLTQTHHDNFLLAKTEAQFMRFLEAPNRVLGIFASDTLCAMAVAGNPTPTNPDTGMDMTLPAAVDEVSVIRAVQVHPDYRGDHLMQTMVALWLKQMHTHGRRHALAEVAAANPYSFRVLMHAGLHIVAAGVDPSDGCELFYLHRPLAEAEALPEPDIYVKGNGTFGVQAALLRRGYVGTRYENGLVGYARRS